jgi:hypothetical protein
MELQSFLEVTNSCPPGLSPPCNLSHLIRICPQPMTVSPPWETECSKLCYICMLSTWMRTRLVVFGAFSHPCKRHFMPAPLAQTKCCSFLCIFWTANLIWTLFHPMPFDSEAGDIMFLWNSDISADSTWSKFPFAVSASSDNCESLKVSLNL